MRKTPDVRLLPFLDELAELLAAQVLASDDKKMPAAAQARHSAMSDCASLNDESVKTGSEEAT